MSFAEVKWNHVPVQFVPGNLERKGIEKGLEHANLRVPDATKGVPRDVFVAVGAYPDQNMIAGVVAQGPDKNILYNIGIDWNPRNPLSVQNALNRVLEYVGTFLKDRY